jgi:hypothetical protein
MRDLPTFLATQATISQAAYGRQRHPGAAVGDVHGALNRANGDPLSVYSWVDVILAGVEGALRSGATPFAIAQALMNRQNQMAATRHPPHLARQTEFIEQRDAARAQAMQEEYGA